MEEIYQSLEQFKADYNNSHVSPLEILQRLGRMFKALRTQWWTAQGHKMSVDDISKILKAARKCHQSSGHAAAFCLAVYNWANGKDFNFVCAMSEMDAEDRMIIVAWGANPFYL